MCKCMDGEGTSVTSASVTHTLLPGAEGFIEWGISFLSGEDPLGYISLGMFRVEERRLGQLMNM